MKHQDDLVEQDSGVKANPLDTDNLQLLINDPEARLIVHCASLLYSSSVDLLTLL
jgi:hypothetical protein